MATQNKELTNEWVDVKSDLSLIDDQKYTFQNTGSMTIRLFEGASVPDEDVYGHELAHRELLSVTPAVGVNVYAKVVQRGLKSNLTVTEAV